ncbi:MAG: hypothetical protein K6A73_00820 [Bacteroidales bacterium]|nr:hypothetical protein [Bacteroidales bacterium]
MVKYCPNCGFEENDFPFDGCPNCNNALLVRNIDGDKSQTVGADNSRQHASKVNIGAGGAVRGDIMSNTITNDYSSSSVVNNVTNVIKEKSAAEKHEDNVRLFSRRCRALYNDGLLSKEGENELEILKNELGIEHDEAHAIMSDAKRLSKRLRTELTLEGRLRIERTLNIINGNQQEALISELNGLRQWKQEYSVEELDQLYYQLYAILTPNPYISEFEQTDDVSYWQSYWAVVAYQLIGINSKAEVAPLNVWDSLYPIQNKLLLQSVIALMQCDESTAREAFNALHAGYSKSLATVTRAVKELLNMDWDRELAVLPPTSQFYYDTLFKDYCNICRRHAEERFEERKQKEKAERMAAEAEAARIAAEAEAARQAKINKMLNEADALFIKKAYDAAKLVYQKVLTIDDGNRIAVSRINEIGNIFEQQETERQQNYINAINAANNAMQVGNFIEAISYYNDALTYKPGDSIATSYLKEAQKKESNRRRSEWWRRNRKWFLIVAVIILAVYLSIKKYNQWEEEKAQLRHQEEIQKRDSIAAAERQKRFDGVLSDFEAFMKQPINVGNATLIIDNGYKIICQLCDTLALYPELSKSSLEEYIRRYNSKVTEAIGVIDNGLKDDRLYDGFYYENKQSFESIKKILKQKYYSK